MTRKILKRWSLFLQQNKDDLVEYVPYKMVKKMIYTPLTGEKNFLPLSSKWKKSYPLANAQSVPEVYIAVSLIVAALNVIYQLYLFAFCN